MTLFNNYTGMYKHNSNSKRLKLVLFLL